MPYAREIETQPGPVRSLRVSTTVYLKTVSFKTFHGRKSENFESWLEDLNESFDKLNMSPADKLKTLPDALENRAKQHYRDLSPHKKESIDLAIKSLSEEFGIQSKAPSEIYKDLSLTQGDMSVSEYSEKLYEKLKNVPIPEGQKIHIYQHGLNTNIKTMLATKDFTTYKELEKWSLKVEESAKNLPMNSTLSQLSADVANIARSTQPQPTNYRPSRRDQYS